MNANFGVVLLKSDREQHFSALPRETRSWGDEVCEIGDSEYSFSLLQDVRCQLFPVTPFIKKQLTADLSSGDVEYVYMHGQGVEEYSAWLATGLGGAGDSQAHPFEKGLLELLNSVRTWAVMFVPSGDRLEEFTSASSGELIHILRSHVYSLASSQGFLAMKR